MKKIILPFALLLGLLSSCSEDPVSCSDEQEAALITHMAGTLENCVCETSVVRGLFLGNTVYYYLSTSPFCNSISPPILYNCNGDKIEHFLLQDQEDFDKLVKFEEVIYRCND